MCRDNITRAAAMERLIENQQGGALNFIPMKDTGWDYNESTITFLMKRELDDGLYDLFMGKAIAQKTTAEARNRKYILALTKVAVKYGLKRITHHFSPTACFK